MRRDLDMLRAEYQQEQRVRENAANCEQLKSEFEKIQRRQRELDRQKEKGTRTTKRAVTSSRPESHTEVDEAPRSKGRFNLDRATQEHINEGLEVWIPTESASSLRGLETQPIRPLMDVALPGYTPSSTPSSSKVRGSSSRLRKLNERLQLRNRESPASVELPPTWREQPVRSVVIASYKEIRMADTTGTTAWIGTRRCGREGIVFMTRLGLNTTHSHKYRRMQFT